MRLIILNAIKLFRDSNSDWKVGKFQKVMGLSDEELVTLFPFSNVNFLRGLSDDRLAEIANNINNFLYRE
jgi:hypothetical protein